MSKQSGNPGFTNQAAGDYTLLKTSPFFGLNATLPTEVTVRGLIPAPTAQPVVLPFSGPAYGN
jgi:hypothetical protein